MASGRVWTAHEDVARRFHEDREAAQRQVDNLSGEQGQSGVCRLCIISLLVVVATKQQWQQQQLRQRQQQPDFLPNVGCSVCMPGHSLDGLTISKDGASSMLLVKT